nr:hypothetical protein [Paenibacillus cremeus]
MRFDPYDLSEIQVWKDGARQENARVLKLRDPKQQQVKAPDAESPAVQPTGLNYVELLYEEHRRQIRESQSAVLQDLIKGAGSHDS